MQGDFGGNPALIDEIAHANSVGVVLTPDWLIKNFSVAADYYTVNVRKEITSLTATAAIPHCVVDHAR